MITDEDLLSSQQQVIFRIVELEEELEESLSIEIIEIEEAASGEGEEQQQAETPEFIKAKFAAAITNRIQAELEEFQKERQKVTIEEDPVKPKIQIEKVSRNGKLQIGANQNIEYSKLFQELFIGESVSNKRRLNESDQIEIKIEDLVNVTLIKQDLPENQKNMTYEMNYSLTNFSEKGFEIELNFSEPEYVSLQKEPDVVMVSINFPSMVFSKENGLPLEDENSVIFFDLPKQFAKGIDQEMVEQQIGNAVNTVGIVPIIGIVIQLYLMHDSGYVFPFLLRVQYVTFFAHFIKHFNMTPLSEVFIETIAKIMLRSDLTVPGLVKLFGMEEKVIQILGWSMNKFQVITGLMNQMWMILILGTLCLLIYFYLVCIHYCFKDNYTSLFIKQMKLILLWDSVVWNSMFQHKNNLFVAVQAYHGMDGDEAIWSTFNFIMYTTTIALHFVIIGGFLFRTSNRDLREDRENKHKFESSTYFFVKLDDRYQLTKFENIFQACRSLMFMAIPLLIEDSAWKVFLTLQIFSIITFVSYAQRSPHYQKHKIWIILNDCYLHLIQFHYIAYTDLIPDPKTKFFVDVSYIGNVILYCCANITYSVYVQVKTAKRYKELLVEREKYRENQKTMKQIERLTKAKLQRELKARLKEVKREKEERKKAVQPKEFEMKFLIPPAEEIWGTDEKPGVQSFEVKFDIPPAEEIWGTLDSGRSSHLSNPIPSEKSDEWNLGAPLQKDPENIVVIEEYDPKKVVYSNQQWGWQDLNLKILSKKVSTIKPMYFD